MEFGTARERNSLRRYSQLLIRNGTNKEVQGGKTMATAMGKQTTSNEEQTGRQPSLRSRAQRTTDSSPMQTNGQRYNSTERLARGLGWFSIGLGAAELLAPRFIANISGVRGRTGLIRLFGIREILAGVTIFSQGKRPAAGVWSRVAGDALDLAALGAAFTSPDSKKGRLAFATANVAAVTALDVICAQRLSSNGQSASHIRKSLLINRSPEELYELWRNFENLPLFMRHLESVQVLDNRRSHWTAVGPVGTNVEWDAEITDERPNEMISWRSLPGSDVDNSGSVWFEPAPGNRGTLVEVDINYSAPGGVVGEWIAKITGNDPGWQAKESLRAFKQLVETGEIIVSDGTVWDNGYLTQRPARPVWDSEESSLTSSVIKGRS